MLLQLLQVKLPVRVDRRGGLSLTWESRDGDRLSRLPRVRLLSRKLPGELAGQRLRQVWLLGHCLRGLARLKLPRSLLTG